MRLAQLDGIRAAARSPGDLSSTLHGRTGRNTTMSQSIASPAIIRNNDSLVLPGTETHISEINALTGLRGVAALCVVLYHWKDGAERLFMRGPRLTFEAHGYLSVDLFFVLSGFVMALNYDGMFARRITRVNYTKFLGKRFARIYPMYLFCLVLIVAFNVGKAPATPRLLVANLLMVQNWGHWSSLNAPSWSIST